MRQEFWLMAVVLAAAPTLAHAECQPSFVSASSSVALRTPSLDDQQNTERFNVEIRNTGSDPCTLRLTVGRDLAASRSSFPAFSLAGPTGMIPTAALPASSRGTDPRTATVVYVPANGVISVPYDLGFSTNWGMASGLYQQDLIYQLLDGESQEELGVQRTTLSLNIPAVARIRFSGASGEDGPAQLSMGPLSPTSRTRSPPFAIRVLSTSAYRIELVSQNGGALRRVDGPDLIPYGLLLDREALDLSGAGDFVTVGSHTGSMGRVHPVRVIIDPDPTRHAGNYTDRVTVTITTM